ncbi:MAG: B12-binding domain-containing radical SAM protein [Candidatus Yanofskybacteria bacterium]|nr:B12-binding domain-containing radical SAM protein [Candidatus Yanofskybacteria bacterium]
MADKILFVVNNVDYIDPMGVMLMSALAKREGFATFLTVLSQDDLGEELKRIKPDIVAHCSVKTGEQQFFLKANDKIKDYSKSIVTIMGGPHPTFNPDIIEESLIDAVGMGECDVAWPKLLKALRDREDTSNIPNIFTRDSWLSKWKNETEANRNRFRHKLTHPLDGLPFYDREIVYSKTHLGKFPMRCFMSSWGCPFECTYCFEPKTNAQQRGLGPIYRRYSPRRLCAELKELKNRYSTQFIKFYDDMFVLSRSVDPWLAEFAEIYPQEVGLPFFCLTRCNVLTRENLTVLKKAGLHSITMSIESGNDYIREKVIKRHMTRPEIEEAFALCNEMGVKTFANSILAIPVKKEIMAEQDKTPIDYDFDSLELNLKSRVTFGEFSPVYPYPGCELSEYVVENGWFDYTDFGKLHASYQNESPLNCFTPLEKRMQSNMSLLGTVFLAFPFLYSRKFAEFLFKLPLAKLYFILYFFVKGYLNVFKIYPMKFSVVSLLLNIRRSIALEYKKHAPGERIYESKRTMSQATTPMLGGLPQGGLIPPPPKPKKKDDIFKIID